MRHKRLKLCVVLLAGLGLAGLRAQENIYTTGGDASGNGGSVSYSVGQLVYQTHSGSMGSVSEGLQQPYEISMLTGIDKDRGLDLRVRVYPNPANDYLMLIIEEPELSNLSYRLYDMNGKLLRNEKIMGIQTSIDMSRLLPANYYVKLIQGNKRVKIFKIIKN